MSRIRSIKPDFFRHRDLYRLELETHLPIRVAFAGLWVVADREGRFRWKPEELKLDILPYDEVDFGDVLGALQRGSFVAKYAVNDRIYGYIPSWREHQYTNVREPASHLPAPPDRAVHRPDRAMHGQDSDRYQKEREGEWEREGKGNGESLPLHAADKPAACDTRAAEPRPVDSPSLLEFPTVGAHGSAWSLQQRQVDEWARLFPGLDILGECRRALAWVQAKPGHRKTIGGMPAFLVHWFNRTVDSGRAWAVGKTAGNEAVKDRFLRRGRP